MDRLVTHHRWVIGLTGGIGSGKSTVAGMLAQCGAGVVDADAVAKRVTAQGGRAIAPIRHAFGPDFITPDGALNRDRMRAHVFAHPHARTQLEAITHPLIRQEMALACQRLSHVEVLVLDIPLLAESSVWRWQLDEVCVVDCSQDTQVSRVMARNGWSQDTIMAVIAAQAPRAHRLAMADHVLVNDGLSLCDLGAHVAHWARRWGLSMADQGVITW
jgi:dephospho-CoA kinase